MRLKFSVIIPAAGSGSRMGKGHNKLFILLDGKPILWHTLMAFSKCAEVEEIILAVQENEKEEIQKIIEMDSFSFPVRMVIGGATRQASVYEALKNVSENVEWVWIHDGARPFVGTLLLERLKTAQETEGSYIAAVRAKDTIKQVNADGKVIGTLDRNLLWQIQTPQIFQTHILKLANEKALLEQFVGTDDASLVEWAGYPVMVVEGDPLNIKITTPEDLILARGILNNF